MSLVNKKWWKINSYQSLQSDFYLYAHLNPICTVLLSDLLKSQYGMFSDASIEENYNYDFIEIMNFIQCGWLAKSINVCLQKYTGVHGSKE